MDRIEIKLNKEPYYEEEGIILYHGDCLEIMPEIADKSIDMILADLPYGVTACEWDLVIPLEPLWEQYKRIIKDNGAIVLTATQPFTSKLVMSNLKMFKYELIWHKTTSASFAVARKQPMKYHENILIFYKYKPTFNPQFQEYSKNTQERFKKGGKVNQVKQLKNSTNKVQGGLSLKASQGIMLNRGKYPESVLRITSEPNCKKRFHPSQKPVVLFEYLIKTYTNPGDLVLDNCAGSGTTGVACKRLNRRCIMIEKEKKYCDIVIERLKNTMRPLF